MQAARAPRLEPAAPADSAAARNAWPCSPSAARAARRQLGRPPRAPPRHRELVAAGAQPPACVRAPRGCSAVLAHQPLDHRQALFHAVERQLTAQLRAQSPAVRDLARTALAVGAPGSRPGRRTRSPARAARSPRTSSRGIGPEIASSSALAPAMRIATPEASPASGASASAAAPPTAQQRIEGRRRRSRTPRQQHLVILASSGRRRRSPRARTRAGRARARAPRRARAASRPLLQGGPAGERLGARSRRAAWSDPHSSSRICICSPKSSACGARAARRRTSAPRRRRAGPRRSPSGPFGIGARAPSPPTPCAPGRSPRRRAGGRSRSCLRSLLGKDREPPRHRPPAPRAARSPCASAPAWRSRSSAWASTVLPHPVAPVSTFNPEQALDGPARSAADSRHAAPTARPQV